MAPRGATYSKRVFYPPFSHVPAPGIVVGAVSMAVGASATQGRPRGRLVAPNARAPRDRPSVKSSKLLSEQPTFLGARRALATPGSAEEERALLRLDRLWACECDQVLDLRQTMR